MAATVDRESETSPLRNINSSSSNDKSSMNASSVSSNYSSLEEMCSAFGGYNIDELYHLATTFLKEKEGKAFNITYKNKLLLVAYSQQVSHGPFQEEKTKPLGYLDVIGRDRRQTWQSLGNMPQKDAKANFINLLHNVCPLFRPFVLAHKCDLEEKERKRKEEEERQKMEEEERLKDEEERLRLEEEEKLEAEREKQKQNHQNHQHLSLTEEWRTIVPTDK